ncbi:MULTISPECIES: type II secretion system F family protein [unclassified Mycobacterium]|uniref:type II secretion system F family protein n=1 Tax=unclassified Mycobacterium TaxID=2642494 RepID=UPI0029C86EFE|nr:MULTISPECIES: type II secretion system F family protein [unclassified Mycobacterium]
MTWAAVCLAGALLVAVDRARVERRAGLTARERADQRRSDGPADPLAVAAALDVFAACLSSGMAVAAAAAATAPSSPAPLAAVLGRAAELLAVGADATTAWSTQDRSDRYVEALTRLARRSAASGAALAQGVAELAEQSRQDAGDAARAAGERAGVLIAGPLGLCYLPAFLCLGVVPVVMGLARDVLTMGTR